ncbi:MAG: glycosyltransferase family 2 protein [Lachnospiraceae bacterium]|jgi:glycosyltransferase involved in cell wall biosynthesis|nr:glycosyltransferase family 2 protein [Lachnospiraceae bacterium]
MKTENKVLIVIPAYNEEKNINKVLDALEKPEIASFADVLVINDASSDETSEVVVARGHTVVNHIFNLGYGSALQVGYKYAIREGYPYVIQMDADGQHDVSNVIRIYHSLFEADEFGRFPDVVLGSRFMSGSSDFPVSLVKRVAYFLFRTLIRMATKRHIADPTTGLQGLSKRAFSYYSKYNHFDDKYPDANCILEMLLLGYQVREIPAVMYQRTVGVSMHSGLKPILYMFRMLFSILAAIFRVKVLKMDSGSGRQIEVKV